MRTPTPVVNISAAATPRARAQRRLRDLAAAAARTAAAPDEPPRGGRAWLNGTELGGYDRRYAHLTRAYE